MGKQKSRNISDEFDANPSEMRGFYFVVASLALPASLDSDHSLRIH